MVFNALEINSFPFSEEIGANAKKGPHTGICGVRTQCRSHQWPSSGDVCGAGMQRLASAVPQLKHMNVVVYIGRGKCTVTRKGV